MITQASTNPLTHIQHIELDGQRIEWCKNFEYLESHIASSKLDIRVRKGLGSLLENERRVLIHSSPAQSRKCRLK
jgi:hypothetical protein